MHATHADTHSGRNAHKHKNIHTASHSSPPDYLESTLKCNNERGNKLIIPISSLFMQASSTVFVIILLFQRHPLGIADCLCTPRTVMTTLPQNIWPCTMGRWDFIVFYSLCLYSFEIFTSAFASLLSGALFPWSCACFQAFLPLVFIWVFERVVLVGLWESEYCQV